MKRKATADNAQFDGSAVPESKDDWKYELDDDGITYGEGLWPFYFTEEGRLVHASLRLVPDHTYQARRNQNVMLMPLWAEDEHCGKAPKVHVSIGAYTRPEGLGGWVSGGSGHHSHQEIAVPMDPAAAVHDREAGKAQAPQGAAVSAPLAP